MHLAPGLLIDLFFHEVQPTIHSGCLRHKAIATFVLWGTMTPSLIFFKHIVELAYLSRDQHLYFL